MCFFVTVAVPSQHADRVGEVFGRGFQLHPTANPNVAAALPAGYVARLVTTGGCSCGLYAKPQSAEAADPAEHLWRKYAKRGWSRAKIERALEQSAVRKPTIDRATFGFRPDVLSGVEALCRAAESVALLVHLYSGDVESERFPLGQPLRCACDELAARARSLDEDQVLIAGRETGSAIRSGGPRAV